MKKEASMPVRIVVAGAGLIGQAHIERILGEPEARLVGIVDIGAKTAAQACALDVPCSADIETMLENARPDGIVIALPNQVHLAAGMAAVRNWRSSSNWFSWSWPLSLVLTRAYNAIRISIS